MSKFPPSSVEPILTRSFWSAGFSLEPAAVCSCVSAEAVFASAESDSVSAVSSALIVQSSEPRMTEKLPYP